MTAPDAPARPADAAPPADAVPPGDADRPADTARPPSAPAPGGRARGRSAGGRRTPRLVGPAHAAALR
ncbi:hypothetical protein ACFW7N_26435, partial [Streptomyces fradiae]